ncbi:MAG: DUF5652 family protein [bacterium]
MNTQVLSGAIASYMSANPWLILLLIWSIVWKLIALWKAAKHNHLVMFIVLGVLNDVGVLEIIYITYLYFKEKKSKEIIK